MSEDYNHLKKEYGWQHDSEFFSFVNNKKCILVGPAEYMTNSNMGKEINNYDVIIRMNLSCPVPKELYKDIGSRTDVLYHLMMREQHVKRSKGVLRLHDKEEIKSWKNNGVKWVVLKNDLRSLERRGGNVEQFMQAINGKINWTNVSGYKYRKLTTQTRNAPNMSTIAVHHLLLSNLKSLHVVGCDYHATGYYTGYGGFTEEQAKLGQGGGPCWGQGRTRPSKKRVHGLEGQLKYMRLLLQRDKRLIIDDKLKEVLGVK